MRNSKPLAQLAKLAQGGGKKTLQPRPIRKEAKQGQKTHLRGDCTRVALIDLWESIRLSLHSSETFSEE